jgi:hypothetical protein
MPSSNQEPHYQTSLPLPGATDKDRINVSYRDIKTRVFDPVIDRIEGLIDRQLSKGDKIESIILVGGFSKSRYLQSRLKTRYQPHVSLLIPANIDCVVSQGAVLYAIHPRMLGPFKRRFVRESFALEVQARFNESKKDLLDNKVTNADGIEYAKSRLVYFVKKNDFTDGVGESRYEKYVYIEYSHNAAIGKNKGIIFVIYRDTWVKDI